MSENFDLVVIGAGPGGYVAAIRAAQLKMKVAIIEKEHLGGICLNWGCIPTKSLLKASELNHMLHKVADYGFTIGEIKFDINKVVASSRNDSAQLTKGIEGLLKKNKITILRGTAKLAANKNVIVTDKDNQTSELIAKNIIIATGARARSLPGLEADGKMIWTYKEAMVPNEMPKSILVVGSGAIGVEFASFYRNMGAEVTLVEVMENILPVEDIEISNFAHKSFEKQGMKIMTSTVVKSFKKNVDDVTVTMENKGKSLNITVEKVIMAVGIVPNTENIGLENTKIKFDRGHIVTNSYMQTDESNIYAIGDVTGAPWLAHKASHEAIVAVEKMAGLETHAIKIKNIPGCTYCRPQIASVGLSEKNAKEQGYDVKVGRFPFYGNGKAIVMGEAEGLVKTIFDSKTGELLGAHMIGAEVTELIQGYVIAKSMEGTELDLMQTIFAHPTLSEMMHEAVLDAYGRAIHI